MKEFLQCLIGVSIVLAIPYFPFFFELGLAKGLIGYCLVVCILGVPSAYFSAFYGLPWS